jgi:hypothetical protein
MDALTTYRTELKAEAAGTLALSILLSHRGRFASVTFTKRTTGERRTLTCLFTPTYLEGQWRFSLPAKGLVPVYDVRAGHIKCIPLDAIESIRAGGRSYTIEDELAAIASAAGITNRRPSAVRPAEPTTRLARRYRERRMARQAQQPAPTESAAEMQERLRQLF